MELGVIEWEVTIEAETKNKIGYSYEVEWEKDVVVTPPLP